MEVIELGPGTPGAPMAAAVTVGVFDGVHLGHQVVIAATRDAAGARGLRSMVVTFDPHPATVVRPQSAPLLLCDLEQRLELLAATGVDATMVVRFDAATAAMEPEDFVRRVLLDQVGAKVVVVGDDFHFGRNRRGSLSMLRTMGEQLGFDALGVSLAGDGAEVVSSSAIRALLQQGEVERAALLLGRPHEVRGVVEAGDRRGTGLGFPTANVAVAANLQLPSEGVYAGWCPFPGGGHAAAVSLGSRPTYYDEGAPVLLEAFLLDFEGDIYGAATAIRFVQRLRPQMRFASSEALMAQIAADVAATREALSVERP